MSIYYGAFRRYTANHNIALAEPPNKAKFRFEFSTKICIQMVRQSSSHPNPPTPFPRPHTLPSFLILNRQLDKQRKSGWRGQLLQRGYLSRSTFNTLNRIRGYVNLTVPALGQNVFAPALERVVLQLHGADARNDRPFLPVVAKQSVGVRVQEREEVVAEFLQAAVQRALQHAVQAAVQRAALRAVQAAVRLLDCQDDATG